jgi:hypothetical protein
MTDAAFLATFLVGWLAGAVSILLCGAYVALRAAFHSPTEGGGAYGLAPQPAAIEPEKPSDAWGGAIPLRRARASFSRKEFE